MAELANGTWVIVADGEKALFLRNVTDAENPTLEVVAKREQENPANREQSESAPGRRSDAGMGQRSAMEETDWHRLAKDRFAHDLADRLYARVHAGEIERLVLVAPPSALGALRDVLHSEVASRLVAEIAKDLTHHPVHEIEKAVMRDLAAV